MSSHPSNASVLLPTVPLLINGIERGPSESNPFDIISPTSNTLLWHCTSSSNQDAIDAVEAADAAFPAWSRTTPTERRDIFLRAATLLEQRIEEFSQYETQETGAPATYTQQFEVPHMIQILRDVGGRISTIYGSIPAGFLETSNSLIVKEPYGVILSIAPWNAPYILGIRSVIYALAAGNTCVLKGSERSPRCFWAIGDLLTNAGLPRGCLNILYHRPEDAAEITRTLIQHKAVRKVNFTGSTRVGSIVAKVAGEALKPCLMELGGKASAIVLEDADLELAAMECVKGAFFHSGQVCMSTERILVHDRIYDKFRSALVKSMDVLAPASSPAMILAMSAGVEKNASLIAQAKSAGAEIIPGEAPKYANEQGGKQNMHQMRPVMLFGVNSSMEIYHEESFGPSVSILRISSWEMAIKVANDTDYGLTASIFTRDLARALGMAKKIRTGAVHINSMTVHDDVSTPHGGLKNSGWGRFNAQWGFEEFMTLKTITF